MEFRITIECEKCGEPVKGEFREADRLIAVGVCTACLAEAAKKEAKETIETIREKVIAFGAKLEDILDD